MERAKHEQKPVPVAIAQAVLGCISFVFLTLLSLFLVVEPLTYLKLINGTLSGVLPAVACVFLSKRSTLSLHLAAIALASQLIHIYRVFEIGLFPSSPWAFQDLSQEPVVATIFVGYAVAAVGLTVLIFTLLSSKSVRSYMSPVNDRKIVDESRTPKSLFDGIDDQEITIA